MMETPNTMAATAEYYLSIVGIILVAAVIIYVGYKVYQGLKKKNDSAE